MKQELLTPLPEKTGERLDRYLSEALDAPRSQVQDWLERGRVEVGGTPRAKNYRLRDGDMVRVFIPDPIAYEAQAERIPLDIVYEDDDLLVVNKPKGMVVHPGCGNYTGTLVNAIAWHLKDNPDYDPNDPTVGLVHRIDKDTSGLLVVAKNADSKTHLGKQFFNKTTKRLYNALVWGSFQEEEGRIEGNIARHPKDRMQMAVFPPDSEIGKHAVTHYRVLENFNYVTLVECRLETGRTHQIRAHMKHIGHPLFNDERYGGNEILRGTQFSKYKQFIQNCFAVCPRQALHARTLGFIHPRSGQEMYFTSELPADMTALLERWRSYTAHRDME